MIFENLKDFLKSLLFPQKKELNQRRNWSIGILGQRLEEEKKRDPECREERREDQGMEGGVARDILGGCIGI